jgi:hypothetical protein
MTASGIDWRLRQGWGGGGGGGGVENRARHSLLRRSIVFDLRFVESDSRAASKEVIGSTRAWLLFPSR